MKHVKRVTTRKHLHVKWQSETRMSKSFFQSSWLRFQLCPKAFTCEHRTVQKKITWLRQICSRAARLLWSVLKSLKHKIWVSYSSKHILHISLLIMSLYIFIHNIYGEKIHETQIFDIPHRLFFLMAVLFQSRATWSLVPQKTLGYFRMLCSPVGCS